MTTCYLCGKRSTIFRCHKCHFEFCSNCVVTYSKPIYGIGHREALAFANRYECPNCRFNVKLEDKGEKEDDGEW